MSSILKKDILRTYELVTGGRLSKIIGCYRSPGVHAVVILRFGQWLSKKNFILRCFLTPVYIFFYYGIRSRWGIEIPRSTAIGEGLYIGHHGGIIISPSAKIGKNANISQQVTIGIAGEGERMGCPTIGDNVYIAPGAKIFGKIVIGNNVKIGANAVIYKSIPDNSVAVLDPGFKIIRTNSSKASVDGSSEPNL